MPETQSKAPTKYNHAGGEGMWGATVEFWSRVGDWTLLAALILGGLTVLTSFASSFISARVTERVQSEARSETARVASATEGAAATAAIANEGAAKASSDAAQARERAAALENENAKLRLQIGQEAAARAAMLQQLQPRDLTKDQIAKIGAAIRGHVGTIYLYVLNDAEARQFSNALGEALRAGGADVKLALTVTPKGPTFPESFDAPVGMLGVTVYEHPHVEGGTVDTLVRAFAAAGIPMTGTWSEQPFANVSSPAIFVGLKPLPFQQYPGYAAPPELERYLREHPPAWNPRKDR